MVTAKQHPASSWGIYQAATWCRAECGLPEVVVDAFRRQGVDGRRLLKLAQASHRCCRPRIMSSSVLSFACVCWSSDAMLACAGCRTMS